MKKFLLLLSMAFIALTVSAQDGITKFVKVTQEPADWCGEYLIVYEADDVNHIAYVFNGGLDELDKKGNFFEATNDKEIIDGEEVRVIDCTNTTETATFTVTKSTETEGMYYIQSKSGLWIGYNNTEPDPSTGEIEPNLKESNEKQFDNSIALADGGTNVVVTAKNGFELRFNNDAGKQRFRYHASGKKKAIKFYKKISITATDDVPADENHASAPVYDLNGRQAVKMNVGNVYVSKGKKYIR